MKKKLNNKHSAIGIQIVINCSDQGINVAGFPEDFVLANQLLDSAKLVVNSYFMELARKGELDENFRKNASQIIIPDKRIVRGVG